MVINFNHGLLKLKTVLALFKEIKQRKKRKENTDFSFELGKEKSPRSNEWNTMENINKKITCLKGMLLCKSNMT